MKKRLPDDHDGLLYNNKVLDDADCHDALSVSWWDVFSNPREKPKDEEKKYTKPNCPRLLGAVSLTVESLISWVIPPEDQDVAYRSQGVTRSVTCPLPHPPPPCVTWPPVASIRSEAVRSGGRGPDRHGWRHLRTNVVIWRLV